LPHVGEGGGELKLAPTMKSSQKSNRCVPGLPCAGPARLAKACAFAHAGALTIVDKTTVVFFTAC